MSKRRGASVKPVGATDGTGGFQEYLLSGSGTNVTATVSVVTPQPGHLQLWYQEDAIAPYVITTVTQAAGLDGDYGDNPRGPGALTWVVVLDAIGNVVLVGSKVDVAD